MTDVCPPAHSCTIRHKTNEKSIKSPQQYYLTFKKLTKTLSFIYSFSKTLMWLLNLITVENLSAFVFRTDTHTFLVLYISIFLFWLIYCINVSLKSWKETKLAATMFDEEWNKGQVQQGHSRPKRTMYITLKRGTSLLLDSTISQDFFNVFTVFPSIILDFDFYWKQQLHFSKC